MAMQLALQLTPHLTLQLAVRLVKHHLALKIKLAMQLSPVVQRLRTTDEKGNSENLRTDVFGHGKPNPTIALRDTFFSFLSMYFIPFHRF